MTEEAEQPPPNISIGKDVSNSNINVGDHNTINNTTIYQPPPAPTPSPLFSIPAPPSNFTGRSAEIEELLPHFTAQDGRGAAISGLSGGGGVGKSALARVLAARLAEQFPDARIQIDLRGAPHPGQRPLTPEEALQMLLRPFLPTAQLPDDLSTLQAIFTDTLRGKRALLLLDNAHNAAQVRPLIPPAPCAVIITSRTRIVLTDLGLYPKALGALRPDEARALLRTHAPLQSVPDGLLDRLARLCGALPLALNVSAALLATRPDWTPQHLLKLLSDERTRLQRLKSPDDPNLDVEASLSLSYNLLDNENQRRFRTLGIFPAPFDLPALQALWDLSPEAADEAIGPLLRLSLIDYVSGERMPYKLHDLTRIYAESLLRRQAEEWDAAVQRHADYFLQDGWETDDLYKKGGENVLEGLRRFDTIWPHLQAAYERTVPQAGNSRVDRWLSDFPRAVAYLANLRLIPYQRVPLLENALTAAQRLQDRYAEGAHLGNLGLAYADLGEPRRAIELYEQQLIISGEIGDRRGEGIALGNLGSAYAALGERDRAIEFYEQRLTIAREIGDRRGEGIVLGNLGNAYADLGASDRAIEFYEQRLAIARETGYKQGEAMTCWNMGLLLEMQGQYLQAAELMQIRINYYNAIGHPQAAALAEQMEAVRKKAESRE